MGQIIGTFPDQLSLRLSDWIERSPAGALQLEYELTVPIFVFIGPTKALRALLQ